MGYTYENTQVTSTDHIYRTPLYSSIQDVIAMYEHARRHARDLGVDTDNDWAHISTDDDDINLLFSTTDVTRSEIDAYPGVTTTPTETEATPHIDPVNNPRT